MDERSPDRSTATCDMYPLAPGASPNCRFSDGENIRAGYLEYWVTRRRRMTRAGAVVMDHKTEPRRAYRLTDDEQAVIRQLYSDMIPDCPRWVQIRHDLVAAGHDLAKLTLMTVPEIVSALSEQQPCIDSNDTAIDSSRVADRPVDALSTAIVKAGISLEWVRRKRPDLTPGDDDKKPYTRGQYEYVRDYDCPSYPDDDCSGSTVPSWETWSRYVRQYRMVTEGSRQSPRSGRPTGASIAKAEDL